MQASQHQPAAPPDTPGTRTSGLRFIVPGDVFAQVCVATYQVSDALLDVTRVIAAYRMIDDDTRAQVEAHLLRAWGLVGDQQKVLQAVCDEGEISAPQGGLQ